MNKHLNTPLAALSALGGLAIHILGGLDQLLIALVALMALDYLTGLAKALCTRSLSSAVGFRGIVRKTLILSVVALAYIAGSLIGSAVPLREMVIVFFAANEGLSILENAAAAGLPIPDGLRRALSQLRGRDGDA
jgi:toxin secretion/phage lysis holin